MNHYISFMDNKINHQHDTIHRRLNVLLFINVALIIVNVLFFCKDMNGEYVVNYIFLHLIGHALSIVLGITCVFINVFVYLSSSKINVYIAIMSALKNNPSQITEDAIVDMEQVQLFKLDQNMRFLHIIHCFTCAILCLLLLCTCG